MSSHVVDIPQYDQKFPYFGKPQLIGEYCVNRDREVSLGRSDAKYLYKVSSRPNGVRFDLNLGKETFEEKEGNEKLDVLLEFATMVSRQGSPIKKVFHEADVVCWRGLLTKIAATPFSTRDDWRFVAKRVDDIVFLCEYKTDAQLKRLESMSERDHLMTYWGHKFEQYMVCDHPGGVPDTSGIVSCKEEFAVVMRSCLATQNGKVLRLAYGAEVDAVDEDGVHVELKTQRRALEGGFWRQKSLKWWIQSFLIGLDRVVVGYRDDDGIVSRVDTVSLSELTKRGEWKANVCFNFLSTILSSIYETLHRDHPDASLHVVYDPQSRRVQMGPAKEDEKNFLSEQFVQHFGLMSKIAV